MPIRRIAAPDQRDPLLHVFSAVGQIHSALDAVKQRRSHSKKAIFRPAIGDGTDVAVHPEGFLDHHQPGNRFAGRARDISVEFVTVRCPQLHMFAHGTLLSC